MIRYKLIKIPESLAPVGIEVGDIVEPFYEGSEYYKKQNKTDRIPSAGLSFNILELQNNPEYWEKIEEENT